MDTVPVIKRPRKRSRTNRSVIILLFLFFTILLVTLFFHSSLAKIQTIEVHGATILQEADIVQQSEIIVGDPFFGLNAVRTADKLQELEWVQSAAVKKDFPGKIILDIREHDVVAYEVAEKGGRAAVLSNGNSILLTAEDPVLDKIILSGWEDQTLKAELANVLASIPDPLLEIISEIRPKPSASYPDKIHIFTRTSFEIETTIAYLPDKLAYLPSILANLQTREIEEGLITLLEADTYTPFDKKDSSKIEE